MISVCTPYWNQRVELDAMIRMYADLYPSLDLEIVVADDGSPQPPSEHPDWVRVVTLPAKHRPLNPCTAINAAVAASTGDIIVLTKPKIVHEGPVLWEMMGKLEGKADYVTARCYGVGYAGVERLPLAGPGVDYTTRGRLPVPEGSHFHFLAAFSRKLWDRAGGFDEDYREVQGCDDNDWLWRVHSVGARFKCAEGTVWQTRSKTRWGLPPGSHVFYKKWPLARAGV